MGASFGCYSRMFECLRYVDEKRGEEIGWYKRAHLSKGGRLSLVSIAQSSLPTLFLSALKILIRMAMEYYRLWISCGKVLEMKVD